MGRKHEELSDPNSCLAKAKNDEPIFILRAQDKLAVPLVRLWTMLAEQLGCDTEKVHAAKRCATDMQNWPIKKWPD